jgi:hypothetical protein
MKTVGFSVALASSILVMNVGGVAQAASLPWSDDSEFQVKNGSADGCLGSGGLAFYDSGNNGIEPGGLVSVDGTVIGSGATTVVVTSSGTDSIATYSDTIGTLGVEISYRFTDDNIARTLVTITNNGGSALTDLPVSIQNVFGDDFDIYHVDGGSWRSSGNWFVSGDSRGYYSEVFHAPDGPGSPESMASVTNCAGSPLDPTSNDSGDMVFGYQMDIPAGESRRILVVQGLSYSGRASDIAPTQPEGVAMIKAAAIAKATAYYSVSLSPGSGIVSDLSAEDACTVVNWAFAGCGSGGGQPSYDIDIDISNYTRESDLPDTL